MTPYKKSTARCAGILDAIRRITATQGYPPSFAQIGQALGMSSSHVRYHLRQMRTAGLVSYQDDMARTVTVVAQPQPVTDAHLETAYEDRVSGGGE